MLEFALSSLFNSSSAAFYEHTRFCVDHAVGYTFPPRTSVRLRRYSVVAPTLPHWPQCLESGGVTCDSAERPIFACLISCTFSFELNWLTFPRRQILKGWSGCSFTVQFTRPNESQSIDHTVVWGNQIWASGLVSRLCWLLEGKTHRKYNKERTRDTTTGIWL